MILLEASTFSLRADEVHVWDARISAFAEHQQQLDALLDDRESERAARFRFARDRTAYVVSHGIVRTLLGRYCGTPPHRLSFAIAAYGKPSLGEPCQEPALEFNLSHSGDIVLVAVTRERPVGVDVERWADDVIPDELAEYCFSPAERAELAAEPTSKTAAFFAGWTRKEAYIKATGFGVSRGLDHFDVSLRSGAAAMLLADRLEGPDGERWCMHDIAIAPHYSAAVVAARGNWRLQRFSFEPCMLDPTQ